MPDVLRLHGLGARVDVRCTGAQAGLLESHLRDAWSRCLVDSTGTPTTVPRETVQVASPLTVALETENGLANRLMVTTQEITRALITAQAGKLIMLHAGAVSHPETGASLVYVAPGGTGKTTLSCLLGTRLGYVTDETVGIDQELNIFPYPKPLSIRPEGGGTKDEVSPDDLGLARVGTAPRATRIVLLDRQPSFGAAPEIEELGLMDALFALVEQTSSLTQLQRPLHGLEALIDACGPVLRYRYTEASDVEKDLIAFSSEAR